jgi:hypothetical protein
LQAKTSPLFTACAMMRLSFRPNTICLAATGLDEIT